VVAIGQRHYGSAQGLSSTSVTHIGLQRIFLNFPLAFLECEVYIEN